MDQPNQPTGKKRRTVDRRLARVEACWSEQRAVNRQLVKIVERLEKGLNGDPPATLGLVAKVHGVELKQKAESATRTTALSIVGVAIVLLTFVVCFLVWDLYEYKSKASGPSRVADSSGAQ